MHNYQDYYMYLFCHAVSLLRSMKKTRFPILPSDTITYNTYQYITYTEEQFYLFIRIYGTYGTKISTYIEK